MMNDSHSLDLEYSLEAPELKALSQAHGVMGDGGTFKGWA
jgi:hypothetical protein